MHRLVFNPATGTYQNQSGIAIVAYGFGDTCHTEYLFADVLGLECPQIELFPYFHTMVQYFVKRHGYVRGTNIAAAPYDWRLAEGLIKY